MRFQLCTQKHLKMIELYVVMQVELDVHATITCPCNIFSRHFHFDVFSTVHTNSCSRFIHLQEHFQINELSRKALSILV